MKKGTTAAIKKALPALLGVLLLSAPLHAEVYCLQLEQESPLLLRESKNAFIHLSHLGLGILRSEEDPQTFAALPGIQGIAKANKNRLFYIPSEPCYPNQQAYLQMISAEEGWEITRGDAGFVVAVLDTGINCAHEDLRENLWINPQEIPNNGIDDDRNGIVDDCHGACFIGEGTMASGDPEDVLFSGQGHGTHVAGIIASPINGVGITGISPNVTIMGIRVFMEDSDGTATASDADILRALDYILGMKKRGINIRGINLSLGTQPGEEEYNPAMEQGLQKVAEAGILIFIAAGNASTNISLPGKEVYPANYSAPNTIVVGASSSSSYSLAYFSNYGPGVTMLAPGVNIYGPVSDFAKILHEKYVPKSGTSMATPLTLGIAMLLWSQNPSLPAGEVKKWLESQATSVPELAAYCSTGAVVSAVQKETPPTPIPTNIPVPTSKPDPLEEFLGSGGG
nr:S8 family serine peptidase [Synergistaceae bacterium]